MELASISDDLVFILDNDDELEVVMELLKKRSKEFNLSINEEKCGVMYTRNWKVRKYCRLHNIKLC